MARLELFVKDVRIADWDIQMPSYSGSCTALKGLSKVDAFKIKCKNREIFISEKVVRMRLNHLRIIMKYPEEWRIELTVRSKV